MSTQTAPKKRVTIHELRRMKDAGDPIAMVTAYDATAARLVANCRPQAHIVIHPPLEAETAAGQTGRPTQRNPGCLDGQHTRAAHGVDQRDLAGPAGQ